MLGTPCQLVMRLRLKGDSLRQRMFHHIHHSDPIVELRARIRTMPVQAQVIMRRPDGSGLRTVTARN
jgi:hypothetical protein